MPRIVNTQWLARIFVNIIEERHLADWVFPFSDECFKMLRSFQKTFLNQ